jgi:hypothetical protein
MVCEEVALECTCTPPPLERILSWYLYVDTQQIAILGLS